ncbi:MAG: hypothetical protein FPO08_04370 [Geobacter sp.]|nr:MAG: hypothetical protein FPO08_04370 [Geobacter sp.]
MRLWIRAVFFFCFLLAAITGCGGGGGATSAPTGGAAAAKIAVDAGGWSGTMTLTTPAGTSQLALYVDSSPSVSNGVTRLGTYKFVGGPLDGKEGIVDVPSGQNINSIEGFDVLLTAYDASFVQLTGRVSATLVNGQKVSAITLTGTRVAGQSIIGAGTLNKVVPTVAAVTPSHAPVGTSITITGTNFDVNSNSLVAFNGGEAVTPVSVSPDGTTITVTVPTGAQSGAVTVSVGAESATTTTTFTVDTNAVPVISQVLPATLLKGQGFTIVGTGFDPWNSFLLPNDPRFTISLTDAASQTWTLLMPNNAGPGNLMITVAVVPIGVASGNGTLQVTVDGVLSNLFPVMVQ